MVVNIKWDKKYSVGVKELDEQHLGLFRIFFTMLEIEDTQSDSPEVAENLQKLRKYTHEHFKREEEYMADCDYPDLESHIRIHKAFRERIEDLLSTETAKKDIDIREVTKTLYKWLVTHICSCDQKYVPYVTAKVTTPE